MSRNRYRREGPGTFILTLAFYAAIVLVTALIVRAVIL